MIPYKIKIVEVFIWKKDFIMYDFMAYSLIDRLDALRIKESEQFVGSKVQEEICSGFKVTNKDCVIVKKTVG